MSHTATVGPALDPSSEDPVVRALARVRIGAPLTPDERRAKAEAFADGFWTDGGLVSAEIAERYNAGA